MSDDPQSEMERSRLLGEQNRLLKAQQHLEQVLSGGANILDLEMSEEGPQAATGHMVSVEQMGGGKNNKVESTLAPQTPGMFELLKRFALSSSKLY